MFAYQDGSYIADMPSHLSARPNEKEPKEIEYHLLAENEEVQRQVSCNTSIIVVLYQGLHFA